MWFMPPEPVPADLPPDPMSAEERAAWLDRVAEQDEPPGLGEWPDPEEELTAAELAEIGEAAADQMLAIEAAATGRRGPGQPGSGRIFPGQSDSPAAGFGPGMALDVLPGSPGLMLSADAAAGDDGTGHPRPARRRPHRQSPRPHRSLRTATACTQRQGQTPACPLAITFIYPP